MCKVVVALFLNFIDTVFFTRFFYDSCQFNKMIFGIIADSGSCPFFFVQHILNRLYQRFRHKFLLAMLAVFALHRIHIVYGTV